MLPSTLYHVTYSGTKFEVATSNGLGGDTFTRNVNDGGTPCTDALTFRNLNYPTRVHT